MRTIQRFDCRPLADRIHAGGALRLQLDDVANQLLRPAGIAQPETRHGVGLGHAIHRQRAVVEFGFHLRDGREFDTVETQVLVNVVGQNPHLRIAQQHIGQPAHFRARIHRTGRVVGRVEQQPLGARRNCGFELLRRQFETALGRAGHFDRRAVAHQHHVEIGNPVRRGNDCLVSRPDGRHHRVENNLLAAGADHDLIGAVFERVLALKFAARGLFEFGYAVDGRILGFIARQRLMDRALHMLRRVEIGLADSKRDDIAALCTQLTGVLRGGGAGGKFDAIQPGGEKRHDYLLVMKYTKSKTLLTTDEHR